MRSRQSERYLEELLSARGDISSYSLPFEVRKIPLLIRTDMSRRRQWCPPTFRDGCARSDGVYRTAVISSFPSGRRIRRDRRDRRRARGCRARIRPRAADRGVLAGVRALSAFEGNCCCNARFRARMRPRRVFARRSTSRRASGRSRSSFAASRASHDCFGRGGERQRPARRYRRSTGGSLRASTRPT